MDKIILYIISVISGILFAIASLYQIKVSRLKLKNTTSEQIETKKEFFSMKFPNKTFNFLLFLSISGVIVVWVLIILRDDPSNKYLFISTQLNTCLIVYNLLTKAIIKLRIEMYDHINKRGNEIYDIIQKILDSLTAPLK